jgi:cytoskeletal protein RodZ
MRFLEEGTHKRINSKIMKTVGEIISTERNKKEISLEKLSQLTKIDIRYLEALEKNDFHSLPAETFIKGFIRNISLRIDKNPDELVAIFRRDYKQSEKLPQAKNITTRKNKLFFEPTRYLPYIVGSFIFLVYLGFQFRAVLTPPKLELQRPIANSVLTSPVEIEGITGVDSQLTIGEDMRIRPDENGSFTAKLSLPIGDTTLSVKSTNRFGRTTTKKLTFTIISK